MNRETSLRHVAMVDEFVDLRRRGTASFFAQLRGGWQRGLEQSLVKKFGRVRLSNNFPSKQIWRRMQTSKDDGFWLGFKFSRVQTSRKGFHELL